MAPPDENFQYRLAYAVSVPLAAIHSTSPRAVHRRPVEPEARHDRARHRDGDDRDDDAPPSAATGEARGVSPDAATVAGVANRGTKATSAWFEYGPTTAYGSSTPVNALPGDSAVARSRPRCPALRFGTGVPLPAGRRERDGDGVRRPTRRSRRRTRRPRRDRRRELPDVDRRAWPGRPDIRACGRPPGSSTGRRPPWGARRSRRRWRRAPSKPPCRPR